MSRVLRGGSWINVADFCRSAGRGNCEPDVRYDSLGFRLAKRDNKICQILRGGAWVAHSGDTIRTARRANHVSAYRDDTLSFRVARRK